MGAQVEGRPSDAPPPSYSPHLSSPLPPNCVGGDVTSHEAPLQVEKLKAKEPKPWRYTFQGTPAAGPPPGHPPNFLAPTGSSALPGTVLLPDAALAQVRAEHSVQYSQVSGRRKL